MSTEGVYGAISRNLLNEIRRENFENSLVYYKGLMLFIGGVVPKIELLVTTTREISKTRNLRSIEDICRAIGRIIF